MAAATVAPTGPPIAAPAPMLPSVENTGGVPSGARAWAP
jgi:hypothetical protein